MVRRGRAPEVALDCISYFPPFAGECVEVPSGLHAHPGGGAESKSKGCQLEGVEVIKFRLKI